MPVLHSLSRALLIGSWAMLASCTKQAPSDPHPDPDPAPAPKPTSESTGKILDLCIHESNDPVCVLRDDGRVSCAHLDDQQFASPLAGITEAVELACGKHSICAREANGSITCLDRAGELRRLDSLPQSRALAPDCAISKDGELHCWDERWKIAHRVFPELSARVRQQGDQSLDLQRVALWPFGDDGCVLRRGGELWCWGGVANNGDPQPRMVTKLDRAEEIRELKANGPKLCWRGDEAWLCTDGKTPPVSGLECDHQVCTCTLRDEFCLSVAEGAADDDPQALRDVVLRKGKCVADLLGRVWCRSWPDFPVHELVFPQTSETVARFGPVARKPPPTPLPDPSLSECPAAVELSNRVCEHLSEPGGPLTCRDDDPSCRRLCGLGSESYWMCEPEGFALMSVRGQHIEAEHVVYVDGPRVWLGPQLDPELGMEVEELSEDGPPTRIELHGEGDDGSIYYEAQYQSSAVILCGLVEDLPACSSPLVREWSYEARELDDDGEEASSEYIRYRADVSVEGTNVTVKVRAGSRHANSQHHNIVGRRVLSSGTYKLDKLLDQPFVRLPD